MVDKKIQIPRTSEQFLQDRKRPPIVSKQMATSVSQVRRGLLEEEVAQGGFNITGGVVSSSVNQTSESFGPTRAGLVVSNQKLTKMAATSTSTSGGWRGGGGTLRQSPDIYSPLWLNSNLNLPRDRATINAWSRAFFALNGIVQSAISLHSTYPISKLNIKCKNPDIEKFFADMIEEIDLMNVCVQLAQEYWILGEAFVYAELDEDNRKWSRLLIQNPDYMVVQRSVVADEPVISLRPDENLKRICTKNGPLELQQRQKLDVSIVEHVRRGENIPLNNFFISHLARKINPYDVRGTGLIVSSFRQLMLFDELRECKFAQAANMINPLTLVKIGGEDFKPNAVDLDAWRQVFEEAQNDKDFKIFTHDKVTVERVGYNQGILDISPDITQLLKEIYSGLMVPSVLMDGGSDTSYANGSVALDVLRQRYLQFRNMLTIWLRRKIFAPISKINDFYEKVQGKNMLIIPEIEWNHMSLFDVDTYINMLSTLATAEKKVVSYQSLYRSLGLNWEDECLKIRQESIEQIIREKEEEQLRAMSLNDLRALGPGDEIQEVVQSPVPGEQVEPTPGEESGGDMGMPGLSMAPPSAPAPAPTPTPLGGPAGSPPA